MTHLRDNTKLKRRIDRLLPAFLKPLAYRLYNGIFERSDVRRGGGENLPDSVLRCVTGYNEYGGYCVPMSASDRPAARRILAGRVHEPDTIAFMREHCGAGDIVHAGTFFGDFLPGLAAASGEGALVWAFEPNPENHRCAQLTIQINALENIRLMNAGLGSTRSNKRVMISGPDGRPLGGASHIVEADATDSDSMPIDIVSIDDVVSPERHVSIIQLDVEGFEKPALEGAMATIRRCLPLIIVEVRPGDMFVQSEWFANSVLSLGYRKTTTLHSNFVFALA